MTIESKVRKCSCGVQLIGYSLAVGTCDECEASLWNRAGAHRTAKDIEASRIHSGAKLLPEIHFGRCSTPHYLGHPTLNGMALTQHMHEKEDDCREWKSEMPVCKHCGYAIAVAQHGEFKGKIVHVLTGNWLCALSAEPESDMGRDLR